MNYCSIWVVSFYKVTIYTGQDNRNSSSGLSEGWPWPLKRECPLRPNHIANIWHMMKNQNFSYSFQRYPRVSLETWCDFFSWNIFLTRQKNQKSVTVPRLVKNRKFQWLIPYPNFALFNLHQNNTPVWAYFWGVNKSFEVNYTSVG